MKYFLVNVGIHVVIFILFLIFIIVTTNSNNKGKTKRGVWYFLPFVLSLITAFHLFVYVAPRLLDIPYAIDQNFYTSSGVIEDISPINNYIVVDGVKYYVNPTYEYPEVGTMVKIKYLGNAHCAVEVLIPETVNITDTINEDIQSSMALETEEN